MVLLRYHAGAWRGACMFSRSQILSATKRNLPLFTFFTLIALAVGFAQTIYDITVTPKGTVFPFTHNYSADFYYYLQLMRQGFQGSWGATSLMTPEVFFAPFINPYFLLLGHLSRLTGIWLPGWYLLARISGGIALCAGIYLFVKQIPEKRRAFPVLALLFTVFGTPVWQYGANGFTMPTLLGFWSELDPMVRFFYIPHHLLSKAFLVFSFFVFLRAEKRGTVSAILFSVCVILMGFASPVTLAPFCLTIAGYAAIGIFISKKGFFSDRRQIFTIAAGLVVAVAVALYHRYVQLSVFPWTSYLAWETVQYPVSPQTYWEVMGPQWILFAFSIPFLVRQGKSGWLLTAWGVSGWAGILISVFLPLSNVRFLEGYQFIPVAIGSAVFLVRAADTVRKQTPSRLFLTITTVFLILYSAGGFAASWTAHLAYSKNDVADPMHYIPDSWMRLFTFLSHEPQRQVVAVPMPLATMIPAMTGERAIAGHQMMTLHSDIKEADLAAIFVFSSKSERLIRTYNVRYLITTDRSIPPSDFLGALAFVPIYHQDGILVYRR